MRSRFSDISVLNAVEGCSAAGCGRHFPSDLLRAEDAINEAIDQQMLVASEAYLEDRDLQIEAGHAEMEASNEKLKVLVQEMHHRIKNNLQMVVRPAYPGDAIQRANELG